MKTLATVTMTPPLGSNSGGLGVDASGWYDTTIPVKDNSGNFTQGVVFPVEGNVVIGQGSLPGENSTSVGFSADVTGDYGVALGAFSIARRDATAIGFNAKSLVEGSISIGGNSTIIDGDFGIAIGNNSYIDAPGAISIGKNSSVTNLNAGAIGPYIGGFSTSSTADNRITLGYAELEVGHPSSGTGTFLRLRDGSGNFHSIGVNSNPSILIDGSPIPSLPAGGSQYQILTKGASNPEWGVYAATGRITLGDSAVAANNYAISIGNSAKGSTGAVSIGYNAGNTSYAYTVSVGYNSVPYGSHSVAVGINTKAAAGTVAVGFNSGSTSSVNGVAVGYQATISSDGAISTGYYATSSGTYSIAHGFDANASHARSAAIGPFLSGGTSSTADNRMTVGYRELEVGHAGDSSKSSFVRLRDTSGTFHNVGVDANTRLTINNLPAVWLPESISHPSNLTQSWTTTYTVRQSFKVNTAAEVSQFALRLKAGSGTVSIDKMYIFLSAANEGGIEYQFSGAPIQVKVGGNGSFTYGTAGVVTDPIYIGQIQPGTILVVAYKLSATSTMLRDSASGNNETKCWYKADDSANQVAPTGYFDYSSTTRNQLLDKVIYRTHPSFEQYLTTQ